jgi:hypothetical protein
MDFSDLLLLYEPQLDSKAKPCKATSQVFPPFHWVFLEGKREKERKKKGIVKILAHFNVSLHGL